MARARCPECGERVQLAEAARLRCPECGTWFEGDEEPPRRRSRRKAGMSGTAITAIGGGLQAMNTIGEKRGAAAPAVPALTAQLRDPNSRRVLAAVLALGRVGPAARDALPALRAVAQQTTNWQTRHEAETVIRIIEFGR